LKYDTKHANFFGLNFAGVLGSSRLPPEEVKEFIGPEADSATTMLPSAGLL
jgi:hypothetical protein